MKMQKAVHITSQLHPNIDIADRVKVTELLVKVVNFVKGCDTSQCKDKSREYVTKGTMVYLETANRLLGLKVEKPKAHIQTTYPICSEIFMEQTHTAHDKQKMIGTLAKSEIETKRYVIAALLSIMQTAQKGGCLIPEDEFNQLLCEAEPAIGSMEFGRWRLKQSIMPRQ